MKKGPLLFLTCHIQREIRTDTTHRSIDRNSGPGSCKDANPLLCELKPTFNRKQSQET